MQYTDPLPCLANLWRSLRSGGTLLITVPALGRIDAIAGDADKWRWTPAGLRSLLDAAGMESTGVQGYGNLIVCQAALLGLAVEDLSEAAIKALDPSFPLTVCARTDKP